MKLFIDQDGHLVPITRCSDANAQDVDGTSASACSTVIDAANKCAVRICAKTAVYVAFGATPTAQAGDVYIPAGGVLECAVLKGEKIAVYGGIANIVKLG